jgi:hypothetical protein
MRDQYMNDNFDYSPQGRTFDRSALNATAMGGMEQANGLPHDMLQPQQSAQKPEDWYALNSIEAAYTGDKLSPNGFAELQRIQHEAMMAQLAQNNAPRPTSRAAGIEFAA